MSTIQTFYAFFDTNVNRYYYYNYETKESLWNYPTKGIVLNPETNEFFENPMMREISPQQEENLQTEEENLNESVQNETNPQNEEEKKEETEDFPIYFKRESKEAEDIHPRKQPKFRARHHTIAYKSPIFNFGDFRPSDSRFLSITDDDLPPLVLEIDESILNFDPSKQAQEQENQADNSHILSDSNKESVIHKRPSFSYIQGINLLQQMQKQLSICNLQYLCSHEIEDEKETPHNQNIITKIDIYNNIDHVHDHSVQHENGDQKEDGITTILQIDQSGVEIHIFTEYSKEEEEYKEEGDNGKVKFIPPNQNYGQKYLPTDVTNGAKSYTLEKYAVKYFKPYSKGTIWNKQTVPLEELVSFSNDPIPSPLLVFLPENLHKPAVKMFKYILEYTQKENKQSAVEIVNIVNSDKKLIDEAYFQLMKQTSGTPDPNVLVRTWQLFLIIATIFPSSHGCEIWIKSHIARSMSNDNNDVKVYARFSYIRFSSRCNIGTIMENVTPEYILEIPSHPFSSATIFGCSLYEIMWGQRRTVPLCPIPYFLVQMAQALISKGCFEHEGIFRKPGNIRKVDEMAANANKGIEVLTDASLDDIASLMKKWFRDLNDYIVPNNLAKFMNIAVNQGQTIPFAAALPPVNSITLAYLIGFLQDLSKHENKTKMGPQNLSMCFSPNIVSPEFSSDSLTAGPGQAFLLDLIEHWDVSLIYPLQF